MMTRTLRLVLALTAAVVVLSGPVPVADQRRLAAGSASVMPRLGGAGPSGQPGVPGIFGPPRQPGAGATTDGRAPRGALADRVQAVLDAQAAALLAGNEAGFLAAADPGADPAFLADLHRRFTVLRTLRVAGWAERLAADPEPVPGGLRARVELRYCFVVAGCAPVAVHADTTWTERGGVPRLSSLHPSPGTDLGPRPWEVSDLRVAVGPRVIVAAPPKYADRLAPALAGAEQAAAVADRYARWGPPPGRYLVYLAGPDEWSRWYGVAEPAWVAGYAMPVSDNDTEIVLNAQKFGDVRDPLQHEFAHAVTLAGVRRSYAPRFWLVEGIAEYVRMVGRPLSAYRGLLATRRYLHSGLWPGTVALDAPALSASADEAIGRYGVAFLAMRCLVDRYGEDRMLSFFDAVVRRGDDPQSASPATLGAPFDEVTARCTGYARTVLG
jgi:hypothetical protein